MYCAALLWLFSAVAFGQSIFPSNSSSDLLPVATSPRFLLNGTEFGLLPAIRLAPLGEYADMSHSSFLDVSVTGHLVNVDASNANAEGSVDQFSYMSCDPSDYTGNLDATDIFSIVVNQPRTDIVILYSSTSSHCGATGLGDLPTVNGILTTTDMLVASMVAKLNLSGDSNGNALILPDLNSYTNGTSGSENGSDGFGQSPTTAVAMIILYSITGIITALFVVIIVTGAIRAHRHPERYGPRNVIGRGRQSRAKGIARAMLETLPIVKFGDRESNVEQQKPATDNQSQSRDIEMNASPQQESDADANSKTAPVAATALPAEEVTEQPSTEGQKAGVVSSSKPDGTDAEGHLGCSICTEDFTKGEEVRVLPCNHKFHPECVDPWLLNVSGTCPLCRIDLRPQGEDGSAVGSGSVAEGDGPLPPPLAEGVEATGPEASRQRRDTFASLRQMANLGVGSREERITALRRLRQERRVRHTGEGPSNEEEETERKGLARRFRERFRIRTERNEGRLDLWFGDRAER